MLPDSFASNEILIQVDNRGIALGHDFSIRYDQTNLNKEAFSFSSRKEIFWRVEEKEFNPANGTLTLEVVNYNEADVKSFYFQEEKRPIQKVVFKKFDGVLLYPLLSSYSPHLLAPHLKNGQIHPVPDYNKQTKQFNQGFLHEKAIIQPIIISNLVLDIPFEDAVFGNGQVSFKARIGDSVFPIIVTNSFLREDFDHIKKWFTKKFKKDTFKVKINAQVKGNDLIDVIAISEEIAKIDQTFINSCKQYHLENTLTTTLPADAKKIGPIDGILIVPGVQAPIFTGTSGLELVRAIVDLGHIRNKQQLEFLCVHPSVSAGRLLVSAYPEVGFIFPFVSGINTCFIWELLDSHATYTWKFKNVISQIDMTELVEKQVSFIYQYGREEYMKNEISQQKELFTFERIVHQKLNEDNNAGSLLKWQQQVNKIIS